ncbi:MAG: serine/threonine protein kinase [Lyngbya sp. HA4199-MV5]|nr:serine/threonine protein kinase [Lyngbya sp. HA4199-MV5]
MPNVLTPVEISYPGLDRLLDGRYQVVQVLATGSWGHTYLAQDTRRPSQPECVIQHIIPVNDDSAYRSALRQIFVREAATLERLGAHEQLPTLLACFEDEQGFHLVQELISGTPLSVELGSQPWQEDQVVQLLLECLEVLAVVHQECCRHGDVRPDNVMRRSPDGTLILTNFGTVRDSHLSLMTLQGLPASSMMPNTQGYQSPEQIQGLPCLASDIYAVGLIGIQALTGSSPLQLSRDALTGEICWQPFGDTAGSTLRHGLVAILSRMVRADHTQRYPSAKEALQALRQLAQAVASGSVSQESAEKPASAIAPLLPLQDSSQALALNTPDPETLADRFFSPAVQIGVGIGAVMAAAVCGYALPHLLDRTLLGDNEQDGQAVADATHRQQAGQLPKPVSAAESIPNQTTPHGSVAAPNRDTLIAQSNAPIAAQQSNAQSADRSAPLAKLVAQPGSELMQAQGAPQMIDRLSSIPPTAQPSDNPAEVASAQSLNDAYGRAIVKDFAGAIEALKQIPAETSVYAKAQEKLREYRDKQQIQAVSYLQTAYNQAENKAFDKALEALEQISSATPTYATAQLKVREYTEKQRVRADVLAMQDLNPGSYLQETKVAGR